MRTKICRRLGRIAEFLVDACSRTSSLSSTAIQGFQLTIVVVRRAPSPEMLISTVGVATI